MRRLSLLVALAMVFTLVGGSSVVAEEPTDTVTYVFEWQITVLQVDDPEYPVQPPGDLGDIGTGFFTVADWNPYQLWTDCGVIYRYDVPGFDLVFEMGDARYEANYHQIATVTDNCDPWVFGENHFGMQGLTGYQWFTPFMSVIFIDYSGDAPSGLDIPMNLQLDDWDEARIGMVYWDTSNPVNAPWQMLADVISLELAGPDWHLSQLVDTVSDLNLAKGINNSLDTKLANAVRALDDVNDNNDVAAVNKLEAFIHEVEAQEGKQISYADAARLISQAQRIIDLLTT